MTAWIYLIIAGVLEIVWAGALKASHGFTRPVPAAIGLGTAALSLFLLSVALRSLPVGLAYTIWVGIGVTGVAVYGIVVLGESVNAVKLGSIVVIGIGIIGLTASES